MYPVTEIPARTEVVIACRSNGNNWVPTSSIQGSIVYTNRNENWHFRIHFLNQLTRNKRTCQVTATYVDPKKRHYSSMGSIGLSDDDDYTNDEETPVIKPNTSIDTDDDTTQKRY